MAAQDATATEDAAADAAFLAAQKEESSTAPAETETAPADSDSAADQGADAFLAAKQDVAKAEADAWNEALAILKAGKSEEAAKEEETPAEQPAAETIPAQTEVKPETVKADPPKAPEVTPEAAKLFERLTQAEIQLRDMQAKLREGEQRAARLAKLEAAIQAADNGDATELFRDHLKWTPETVAAYMEKGPDALKPTVTDKKLSTLEQKLADYEAREKRREAEATLNSYKSSLAQEISKRANDYQWLTRNHTDPDSKAFDKHAAANEICDYQGQMLLSKGINLTFDEAAAALDKTYETLAKRFIPAGQSQTTVTNPTVAKKPPAPAPKVTKPPRGPADPNEDPDLTSALAVIRQARASR